MFIAKMTHHDGNHRDRALAVYGTGKDQNKFVLVLRGTNVIEIEGLLFLGFGPMRAFHGKLVFPVFPIK